MPSASCCRVTPVRGGRACQPSKPSDAMEAPSRGMLRRPIGLLPSATTRAERMPESIGHVSVVQVMSMVEQTSMEGGEKNPTGAPVACAEVMLPVTRAEPVSSPGDGSTALVQVSAVPCALACTMEQANSVLPWGQLVKAWCSTAACDAALRDARERSEGQELDT